jgi:hypothetical protein
MIRKKYFIQYCTSNFTTLSMHLDKFIVFITGIEHEGGNLFFNLFLSF